MLTLNKKRVMPTSIPFRLERALSKLYAAFIDGSLHPGCCTACAVGTICDNKDMWKHMTDAHGSLVLNYVGKVNETFGKRFYGYLPSELLQIEGVFLRACGYELPLNRSSIKPENPQSDAVMFNGMRAVIHYLCDLDGVQDVMDIQEQFLYARVDKNSLSVV